MGVKEIYSVNEVDDDGELLMSELEIVEHALELPLGGGGLSGALLLLVLVVLLHRPRKIDSLNQRLPLLLVP